MKKLATLCMALAVLSGVAVPASAADYSFRLTRNRNTTIAQTMKIGMMRPITMVSIIRSTMIFLKSNTGSARNFLNSPSITPTYPVASSMASMGTRSLAVAILNRIFLLSATAAILRSLTDLN